MADLHKIFHLHIYIFRIYINIKYLHKIHKISPVNCVIYIHSCILRVNHYKFPE